MMPKATKSKNCQLCGGDLSLEDREGERGACHACRSPKGKLADLDTAIRASGDTPERISEWAKIRHHLRQRFGLDLEYKEQWQRFKDWLHAEVGLDAESIARLPLERVIVLLRDGIKGSHKAESKPKKRGRPKADYDTEQQEMKILEEWEKAREAGVYQSQFAKDKGMSHKELMRLLDRRRRQIAREDK